MTTTEDTAADHLETQDNIPWLVIGRLDAERAARANRHLTVCPDCRAEHAIQQGLQAAIVAAPTEAAAASDFAALEQRIDDFERNRPAPAAQRGARAGRTTRASARWAGRAAMVLVVLAAAGLAVQRWAAPRYATATDSADAPAGVGTAIRLVVIPSIEVAEFESLLRRSDARVIDGPNSEHAWTIELPARMRGPAVSQVLVTLQRDPRVRLAEPLPGRQPP